MADATIAIRTDEPIGAISSRLYGHFAEHLGHCCYDGHAPHIGATALPVGLEGGGLIPDGSPAFAATASAKDSEMTLSVVHQDRERGYVVRLNAESVIVVEGATLLTASHPSAPNTAEDPEGVAPTVLTDSGDDGNGMSVDLPPHSAATMRLVAA